MKAIQFKKTNHYTGNHDEVTGMLGGTVVYVGQRGNTETIKSYERDNQAFPLQFDDWIVDIDGVILILSEVQYQAFLSLVSPQKSLGDAISEAVRNVIKSEKMQGGLLSSKHPDDHCAADIESCKKRLKDQNGFVKSTRPLTTDMKLLWGNPKDEQP
ncbi:hypothetical protein ACG9ZJ_06150 [Acinetobacter sp. ULE_I064]|uniref:hypothetical protein n=1 Tax=Acinetobacter sp. ULE_I064 TaxID=3373071 RepID=UPI003AF85B69